MTRAQHAVRERRRPSSAGPRIVVYGAIVANLAIAMTKFVAAGITGSSAMLAEDAAALGGLPVAAIGVYLSHRLLIGEGVRPDTALAIRDIAARNPRVRAAATPLSMYLGPDEIPVNLDVDFERDSSADQIVAAVANIERDIRLRYPKITRIYIEARSISEASTPAGQFR
jgi:divalent metal cation (Fe/Co/Zn/Cd) transporter